MLVSSIVLPHFRYISLFLTQNSCLKLEESCSAKCHLFLSKRFGSCPGYLCFLFQSHVVQALFCCFFLVSLLSFSLFVKIFWAKLCEILCTFLFVRGSFPSFLFAFRYFAYRFLVLLSLLSSSSSLLFSSLSLFCISFFRFLQSLNSSCTKWLLIASFSQQQELQKGAKTMQNKWFKLLQFPFEQFFVSISIFVCSLFPLSLRNTKS